MSETDISFKRHPALPIYLRDKCSHCRVLIVNSYKQNTINQIGACVMTGFSYQANVYLTKSFSNIKNN
jgi:poly(3-hydroxyalkanoate) synthetase